MRGGDYMSKTHKVNVTVDQETRDRMDEFPEVNWSSIFRTAVRVRTDKMRVVRDCDHVWGEFRVSKQDALGNETEEIRNCEVCGAAAKRVVTLFTYDYRESS